MKQITLLTKIGMMAFIALFISVSMTSCGEDEPEIIMGCTNPNGDQYNANATDDDGSCTFFNRFTGDWDGVFACPGLLAELFTSAQLTIAEAVSTTNDNVSVIVNSTALPLPVPTNGVITESGLTITQSLTGIEIDLIDAIPGAETWDINVDGTLTLSADGTTLSGNVMIGLTEVSGTMLALSDNCVYTATKM